MVKTETVGNLFMQEIGERHLKPKFCIFVLYPKVTNTVLKNNIFNPKEKVREIQKWHQNVQGQVIFKVIFKQYFAYFDL